MANQKSRPVLWGGSRSYTNLYHYADLVLWTLLWVARTHTGLVSKSSTRSSWEANKISDASFGIHTFHGNHSTYLYLSFHCFYTGSLALLSNWQTWNLNRKTGVRVPDCSKILRNEENCKVERHCLSIGLSLQKACKWPCLQVHCSILWDCPAEAYPHRNTFTHPCMHISMQHHVTYLHRKWNCLKLYCLNNFCKT